VTTPRLRSPLGAAVLGAGFGAATSLSNRIVTPFDSDSLARVPSLVLDAGWAWAGLAVVAGWLAGAPARGAVAGAVALLAATTVYYVTDSVARDEPFARYGPELLLWWLASVVGGPALGAVGAYVNRPGVPGLLAGLVIPVGMAAQMIVLPLGAGSAVATPAERWARLIVWAAAAVGGAVVVAVSFMRKRRRSE
jgi:hypothetical protein